VKIFRRIGIATRAVWDLQNWQEVLSGVTRGESVPVIRLRDGTIIHAAHALWPHFSETWYHRAYTRHLSIPRGGVVVDVGANVGVFSLLAARKARVVYALEPASDNFRQLTRNVTTHQRIHPLQLACGATDGRAVLDTTADPVSYSLYTGGGGEDVEVVTLSTLFRRLRIDRCDFLKLDCEGSEFGIIGDTGAMKRVERVALEYHDRLAPQRASHTDLISMLRTLGFTRVFQYGMRETQGMIAASR